MPPRFVQAVVGVVCAALPLGVLVAACSSSERPPGSSGVVVPSTNDGSNVDAETLGDSSADQDAGSNDSSVDQFAVNGPCLEDKPAQPSQLDGGVAAACPDSGTCATACERIRANYKIGVAQVAISCILSLGSCTTTTDVIACVDGALGRACSDATSAAYCTPLVTTCDPNAGKPGSSIDQAGCVSFANGLSSTGRATFQSCIDAKVAAGTCPLEVVMCADEVRQ